MATLLRFLSVFCLAPFLLSLHAIAEMTVPSDRNRPASERTENGIDGFGDSSRMAASPPTDGDFVIGEQRLGKQLLQNDADSSNPEYACALSRSEVRRYLDTATRTWRIDDAVLEAIDNDLQVIVNCTTEGDTLVFDVTVAIQPAATVIIPWNVTISAATGRTRSVDGLYPRALLKASITCPVEGEGVFLVRSRSVLLANLRFENCSLRGSSGSRGIVEVKECQSSRTQGVIQLQHVSFERNTVIDAAALAMESPSCSRLELMDFEFSDNECGGHCGVTLSHQNRLENIRIRQNRLSDSANASTVVFRGSDGSETSVERMDATGNACPILHVESGSLDLSNASFVQNAVNISEADADTPCIRLSNASASVRDTRFEKNACTTGSTISATSSNVSLANDTFKRNEAREGGALSLRAASSAVIQSCRFVANRANSSGGVLVASESDVAVADSTFRKNTADVGGVLYLDLALTANLSDCEFDQNNASTSGGAVHAKESRLDIRRCRIDKGSAEQGAGLYITETQIVGDGLNLADNNGSAVYAVESELSIRDSLFRNNSAVRGGAVRLSTNSVGVFVGVNFTENSASLEGGSVHVSESNATIRRCVLNNGRAESSGGCLEIIEASYVDIRHSLFRNGTAMSGACINCETGTVTVHNVTLQECQAGHAGGAIRVTLSGTAVMTRIRFVLNRAAYGGGFYGRGASMISGDELVFESNAVDASGGGLYAVSSDNMTVTNSLFRNNSATSGGAILEAYGENDNLVNATLIDNQATYTGGALHTEHSAFNLSRCTLKNSQGEIGGFIYTLENSLLLINDSSLENGTARLGGCIDSSDGNLTLQNTVIQDCRASKDGGGLRLTEHASAVLTNVSITASHSDDKGGGIEISRSNLTASRLLLAGNNAASNGGGLFSTEPSAVNITDAHISNNTARLGGALDLRRNTTGNLANITFAGNRAAESGGHCHMKASSLSVTSSSLANGTAERGGSFFLSESMLNISDLEIADGKVSESGGFVSAEEMSEMFVESTSMFNGSADVDGGAIALSESDVRAKNMTVSYCTAEEDGGAIAGRSASRILCVNCTLHDNNATRGGAVFLEYTDPRSLALQLEGSTVVNNSAVYGGGLHVAREEQAAHQNCSQRQGDICGVVAVVNSSLSGNGAEAAGGGVVVDRAAIMRVQCPAQTSSEEPEFYSRKQLESLMGLEFAEDICPAMSGNAAGRYGQEVASYLASIEMNILGEREGDVVSVNEDTYIIRNHKSGTPLPTIALRAVDDFGQDPAVGSNSREVFAVMSSPDGLFDGRVGVLLDQDVVHLTTTGFATPGTYKVIVEFDQEQINSMEITVEVKSCDMGEVPSGNGTFCEPCTTSTFSFHPDDDLACHPCPENGNCETRVILPKKGYWHKTPCSEHIQRCLASDGCDFEDRQQDMIEATKDVESCEFDEESLENYAEAQCREGHDGPLCGSCKESYGKTHSFLCEKCFSGFGNYALIFVSFLVLMGLSSFTVRSNRTPVTAAASPWPPEESASQPALASASTRSVPVNEQMVEMMVTGNVPSKFLSSRYDHRIDPEQRNDQEQENDPNRSLEDAELAKWKAVEMFKITVDFLQVTAIAIAVNVEWTFAIIAMFEAAEFVSGITSEAVNRSVDCIIPTTASIERSIGSTLVDIFQPLAAILVYAIFWFMIKTCYQKTWIYLLKKVILSSLVIFYISYISLSKSLVNILSCIRVHDSVSVGVDHTTDYWSVDTAIKCYEGSHAVLAGVLGWPFLVIFTFGFPAVIGYVTVCNVKEDYKEGWIYDVAGFLYRSYRKKYIFWESIILLRKAILAVVVVFSYPLGADLQQVLAVFVLILALYVQTVCRPYRHEFDVLNEMEGASILVSSMTFVSSIFFSEDRVSSVVRVLVAIGVVLCNAMLLFCFLCCFVSFGATYLRMALINEGVPVDPNSGPHHIIRVYVTDHIFVLFKQSFLSLCRRRGSGRRRTSVTANPTRGTSH